MTATFEDLCAAAAEPARVAAFWGAVLGFDVEVQPDGDAVLRAGGRVWLRVNRGSGPKTVKNRVHLDLQVPDERALTRLGATRLADRDEFRVFADPEGNEFCAFPGDAPARAVVAAVCTDSADPVAAAAWWAGVTGATPVAGPDGAPRYLDGVPGLDGATWKFVPVPDARIVKNRWHWDVTADVGELVAAGAAVLRPEADGTGWTLLADPEGNEFCASARRHP